jgi:hypothetical protein
MASEGKAGILAGSTASLDERLPIPADLARALNRRGFAYVKETAAALELSEQTVCNRIRAWMTDRAAPHGIPVILPLGRPYRIPAAWIRSVLG